MLALLGAVFALLAIAPLWATLPARAHLLLRILLTAAALFVAGKVLFSEPDEEQPVARRPLEVPDQGYVGSAHCRACHPDQHASWHDSFHRTMTQVFSRDALVPKFDPVQQLDWFGKPVRLEWRGDELWCEFHRGGGTPADVHRPIVQLTGSHHLQVLWYSTGEGRELAPLPLCWRIDEARWLPITAVFVVPPELHDPPDPGLWNQRCQACHATESRPRLDGEHPDTLVGEFGIACEACHGPGGAHIAENQNPLRRYQHHDSGGDDSIVQPGKLPAARSAQVCGQCHSVSVLRRDHLDRWSKEGMPYRPGQDLDATVRVIGREDSGVPEVRAQLRRDPGLLDNSFWPDGQVRVSGREYNGLLLSPCYRRGTGDRQLDCSSCHQMHRPPGVAAEQWRDAQLRAGMRGNAACTSCHPALREPAALAAHTHHRPESPGSNCYNCHMSYTTFGLMKAMRSHTITSPSVQAELATGRPNACNQCHLDRTLQWANENLHAFYGTPPAVLDDEQREVAASVRWLLTGDAGQRALAAWSCGWDEAQAAAGTDWMAPYLARLLDDPYYVVRFTAARALRSLPGAPFTSLLRDYEVLADRAVAGRAGEAVTAQWRAAYRGPERGALLLEQRGLDRARFERLYARRNDRPVFLAE